MNNKEMLVTFHHLDHSTIHTGSEFSLSKFTQNCCEVPFSSSVFHLRYFSPQEIVLFLFFISQEIPLQDHFFLSG